MCDTTCTCCTQVCYSHCILLVVSLHKCIISLSVLYLHTHYSRWWWISFGFTDEISNSFFPSSASLHSSAVSGSTQSMGGGKGSSEKVHCTCTTVQPRLSEPLWPTSEISLFGYAKGSHTINDAILSSTYKRLAYVILLIQKNNSFTFLRLFADVLPWMAAVWHSSACALIGQ